MSKEKLKKLIAAALMLTAGAVIFTGCGKENVDYNIGNGTATGSDSMAEKDSAGRGNAGESGEIRTKVNAPDSYEGEIPVGDSGLKSINIKADKIEIPDVSTMSVIYCDKAYGGEEFEKNILEKCFDTEKGLYIEDHLHLNKDDMDLQIEKYQKGYDAAMAAGDTEYIERYSDALETYRNGAHNVMSDRVPLTDYTDIDTRSDILGYRGDELYSMTFDSGADSVFGVNADMRIYPVQQIDNLRPLADAQDVVGVSFYENSIEETGVDNKSEMTAEEAQDIARDYFESIGVADTMVSYCTDMYWCYYDYKNDIIAEEADGYVVSMKRTVNGAELYNPYLNNIDYFDTSGDISYLLTNEAFKVYVYDDRVIGANMTIGFNKIDEDSNVGLLTWDEILEAAKTGIPEYYGSLDNKTGYLDITFDEVKLTYYRVNDTETDENGNEVMKGYRLIPVWAFVCTDPGKNGGDNFVGAGDRDMYPFQLVIINAMDGSVVNLAEEVGY